jgi:hypothetical protein
LAFHETETTRNERAKWQRKTYYGHKQNNPGTNKTIRAQTKQSGHKQNNYGHKQNNPGTNKTIRAQTKQSVFVSFLRNTGGGPNLKERPSALKTSFAA